MTTIGVLAVQGAFIEHEDMLRSLGADCFEIRKASDADREMDGLVLPGGESTVQGKLMRDLGIFDRLRERIVGGLPVFGTCAGMILLAEHISNDDRVHFGTMPITVKRNAYGRQLGSFSDKGSFGNISEVPLEFIRAPYIESMGDGVEVLTVCKGKTVAARYGNQLVTAFHPELTDDTKVHEYFLSMISNHRQRLDFKVVPSFGGLESITEEQIRKNIADYPYVMGKLKNCR